MQEITDFGIKLTYKNFWIDNTLSSYDFTDMVHSLVADVRKIESRLHTKAKKCMSCGLTEFFDRNLITLPCSHYIHELCLEDQARLKKIKVDLHDNTFVDCYECGTKGKEIDPVVS